jgi:hypothetical protein
MPMVRELLSREEGQRADSPSDSPAMITGEVTPEFLGACLRLVELLETPQDIPFLSGLIQREIIYRILRGAEGARLWAIATLGDQSNRPAKAIAWIRANYARPLRVEDLAELAGMGVSTLHHHFRALTAMSPLQYQKQLRLHTVRGACLLMASMPPARHSMSDTKARAVQSRIQPLLRAAADEGHSDPSLTRRSTPGLSRQLVTDDVRADHRARRGMSSEACYDPTQNERITLNLVRLAPCPRALFRTKKNRFRPRRTARWDVHGNIWSVCWQAGLFGPLKASGTFFVMRSNKRSQARAL